MKRKINLFISILLIISLSPILMGAVNSSDFFYFYKSTASRDNSSKITVTFEATSTSPLSEIGVKTIEFERSIDEITWNKVATYRYEDYPNMMNYNSSFINSSVSYQGSSLYKYRVVVTFWAQKGEAGEEKVYTTPVV